MRTWYFSFLLPALALAQTPISFEKEIAPILRTHCAGCHNNDDLEGGLSVETHAQLRKGGDEHENPIAPGDPSKSHFFKVLDGSAKPKMPPKDEPPLPAEDLATLKRWIAEGAPGPRQDQSILQTLVAPSLPAATKPVAITGAEYSPDGKLLAVARYATVEIRDGVTNEVRITMDGFAGKVTAVHFSPDAKYIVAASGITGLAGSAQVRSLATGAVVQEFGGHRDMLYDAEFSPDGKLLATAGYDRVIRLWQVENGKLLRAIDVHKGAVFDLAFHPDGKVLASASADETVKLWRVSDGLRLDTLNQPQGEQVAVVFTKEGNHLVSTGADKRIHLWKLVSREKPELNPLIHSRFAHEAPIVGLALSADGKHLLSSATDRTTKLWSVPDLALQHAYEAQPDVASVIAPIARSNRFFMGRMDGGTAQLEIAGQAAQAKPPQVPWVTTPSASAAATVTKSTELEPNNEPAQAGTMDSPTEIEGAIAAAGDRDVFRFKARAGEALVLEIHAARRKSPLDSRLEVLHADGRPVEQVVLQATRDSWFTFRGKSSEDSDDFRLHNWAEMELNEYLYANGEVVKLWLYPRGPDSGFKVYPGEGKRHTMFGTTALSHALGAPAYIVSPLPPGSQPTPNGLPVFRLNYENDDDPTRRAGADSMLHFTAPADGDYLVRVSDVRGFGGADFTYQLSLRPRLPDFKVNVATMNPKVSPGSGRELAFKVERLDGYDGPVRIELENLPAGFRSSGTVEIEAGQVAAFGALYAASDAVNPDSAADQAVKVRAVGKVDGREISHELGGLGDIQLGAPAKVTIAVQPGPDRSCVREGENEPLELTIRPGQTISAKVQAVRHDFKGRIEVGKEDAGRNLPHGLYVDNIGLNGLLIVEGQTEREFFITASPIAQPGTRLFHLKTGADDGQVTPPVRIRVAEAAPAASARR